MAVKKIPMKSKIIFSKLLLSIMNKELVSIDEITKKASINYKKKKLREEYSEIQEKYEASIIDNETLKEQMQLYNLELTKLELEYYKIAENIQEKDLYYKRLEILHDILNSDQEDSIVKTDDLYSDLIEAIKDEVIKDLEVKLKISNLELEIGTYSKQFTNEDICKYQDQIYELKLELRETKKVLKIDKLDKIKEFPFEKLVEESYNLLNSLYEEEIYDQK